jgi:uncharacterized protein (DUF1800 family)
MSTVPPTAAVAQAFTRFGLGGRPDDPIPANPAAWLGAQLTGPDPAPVAGMPSLASGLALAYQQLQAPVGSSQEVTLTRQMWTNLEAERQEFLSYAVTTRAPFRERLVWFWANHFAIMAATVAMTGVAGPFIRDAIRPYVTGTIGQMLQAVITHPAMIYSLNADSSYGPQSPLAIAAAKAGKIRNINENLGRELLELYTVGVQAGYGQADVDAMAYLLTGLQVNNAPGAPLGTFYNPAKQQPGNQTVLGVTYPGTQAGLYGALNTLATHPATYQHLATKLVTAFVSDTPLAADIQAVAQAFATSGGSLPAAHQALIALPNAWIPLQKLRTPQEFTIAALRAANTTAATMPGSINAILNPMGQPTWQPPFPNGWSDLAADWTGPQPMLLRADWTGSFAASLAGITPAEAAQASVAPFLSSRTAGALNAAATQQAQFALLFCSSEFQRR